MTRGEIVDDDWRQGVPEGDADTAGEFAQQGLSPEDRAEQVDD